VRTIELFKALSDKDLAQLQTISKEQVYEKNRLLFMEGEQPTQLHLLLEGIVKVYKVDAKGNEVVLHHFQAQSLIAESAHIQAVAFPATAVCETTCTVLAIDFKAFAKEFLSKTEISMKIISSLSGKIQSLQEVINSQLTMRAKARVSKFLYENETLLAQMSHRKIATILNITPETLSRTLSRFKDANILSVKQRKIILHDKEKLLHYY